MRDFFQEQLKELSRELVKMGADCEEISPWPPNL